MVFVKLKAKLSHSLILTNWFLEQGQAFNILGFRFPSWGQEGLERSEGTSAVRQQGVAGTVVKSRAYAVWVGGVGQLQCGPYGAQGLGLPGLQFCLFLFSGKARDLTLLPTFPPLKTNHYFGCAGTPWAHLCSHLCWDKFISCHERLSYFIL